MLRRPSIRPTDLKIFVSGSGLSRSATVAKVPDLADPTLRADATSAGGPRQNPENLSLSRQTRLCGSNNVPRYSTGTVVTGTTASATQMMWDVEESCAVVARRKMRGASTRKCTSQVHNASLAAMMPLSRQRDETCFRYTHTHTERKSECSNSHLS